MIKTTPFRVFDYITDHETFEEYAAVIKAEAFESGRRAGAAEMRERAAEIADELNSPEHHDRSTRLTARHIAAAIRALALPEPPR